MWITCNEWNNNNDDDNDIDIKIKTVFKCKHEINLEQELIKNKNTSDIF